MARVLSGDQRNTLVGALLRGLLITLVPLLLAVPAIVGALCGRPACALATALGVCGLFAPNFIARRAVRRWLTGASVLSLLAAVIFASQVSLSC
jgi:hypothetical protein